MPACSSSASSTGAKSHPRSSFSSRGPAPGEVISNVEDLVWRKFSSLLRPPMSMSDSRQPPSTALKRACPGSALASKGSACAVRLCIWGYLRGRKRQDRAEEPGPCQVLDHPITPRHAERPDLTDQEDRPARPDPRAGPPAGKGWWTRRPGRGSPRRSRSSRRCGDRGWPRSSRRTRSPSVPGWPPNTSTGTPVRLRTTDAVRYRRELQRARSLLFVAATRSRDSLAIFRHGRPSPFLEPLMSLRAG